MVQFNTEIAVTLAQAVCYLGLIVLSIHQGMQRKKSLFLYFTFIFLLYMLQNLFQGLSYMILLENYPLAYIFKVLSVVFTILVIFFSIMLIDYIQLQRFRVWLLILIAVLGTFEFCILLLADGLVLYVFMEGGDVIATSIGKTGIGLILDLILSITNALVLLTFFAKSYRQSPPKLKKETRKLFLSLLILMILAMFCNALSRFLPNNQITLVLYSSMGLLLLIFAGILLFSVISHPQVLYILPFRVDRLVIINAGGLCLYSYDFSPVSVDNMLFSGFMHGLQQISVEVLQKGGMRDISLEQGVLLFRKMPRFTICLVTTQSSKMLTQSFEAFAEAFNHRFQNKLDNFDGDVSGFLDADKLITQYFDFIPIRL